MKPVYAENIVVAIKHDNCIEWYVLDKDYCFLDYIKLEEAYREKGYDIYIDDSSRFGIKIVNELTQMAFLKNISGYKVTSLKLRNFLKGEKNHNDKLAYNPSVLIDFDSKMLLSNYAEPESFEDFVPDGWHGKYEDFMIDIPQEQKYWIDIDGQSLLGQ